jgi:hypothetical protein
VESLDAKKPIDDDVTTFENHIWAISSQLAARKPRRLKRRVNVKDFIDSC